MDAADRLRTARRTLGLTQAEMAQLAGTTQLAMNDEFAQLERAVPELMGSLDAVEPGTAGN